MRGREYLCAIIAEHGILRAETLRFADEVRSPEAIGLPLRVPAKAADVAQFAKAIKSLKARTLDRGELVNQRAARIVALAEHKLEAGIDVAHARADDASGEKAEVQPTNVVDLMEVLKERLRGKLRARAAPAGGEGKATPAGATNLRSKSKDELYEIAKSRDVPGRSGMSKAKLIGALSQKSR